MEQLDDIVKEFLVESYESLDQLDRDLMALENSPDDRERLASIFRTIHTIKGTSGFLAFPKLEHVTHVGESLLVPLRDGEMRFTNEIADGLLKMLDSVRQILGHIEGGHGEGDAEYFDVIRTLEELRSGPIQHTVPKPAPVAKPVTPNKKAAAKPRNRKGKKAAVEVADGPTIAVETALDKLTDDLQDLTEEPVNSPGESHPDFDAAAEFVDEGKSVAPSSANATAPRTATPAPSRESRNDSNERSNSISDTTVRLDVELLDRLMNLVGELVLARNQILQFSRSSEDATMATASQRLNLITTELQEGVMKTRMQPIRNAWSKLPRVVRDLSNSCRKRVQVRMDGADTELDKTILEAIKDPLTHIVRNAVDHGIEAPEDRVAAGKPPEGTLWLRAFHEGGQVNVEIRDDGGGIHLERVKQKAISNGLATPEQVAAMNDRELTNLILLPGFSTAQKVTNVSGRGVGMDVVKTNVEKIGGTLEIQSVFGRGTTLRIKIPLTLAIVPALVVTCEGDRYAIPQVSLLELVRLDGGRAKREIELIHNVPAYRLRGHLLPLLYLDEELGLRGKRLPRDHGNEESVNIVVLQAEDRQFGLVVDQINDTQEIVVKPLGQQLKGVSTYAGATIMGDGSVSLILDVNGIAANGHILTEQHDYSLSDANVGVVDSKSNLTSWLLVDPGDGTRAAIPLETVDRLEEFRVDQIENVSNHQVVQYRGQIMPLISLTSAGFVGNGIGESVQVVVYSYQSLCVGIVVGRILDVVDDVNVNSPDAARTRTRVISGRVTSLVNLDEFIMNTIPMLADVFTAV